MGKLKWAILSTGTIAKNFAKTALALQDEMTLYAVASRNLKNAEQFAKDYHIQNAYGSYEAMIQDPEIDVVYVATPHSLHYENMLLCLHHGKHILCEKSFTVNKKQAKDIYDLAKEKHLFVMEAFWTKFAPVYRELEQILSNGIIGEIKFLTAQYGYKAHGDRLKRKFNPDLAGGTLLDIGVYAIGFACMVMGYNPIELLSTVQLNSVNTDESENILMKYEDGKTAQIITSIGTQIPILANIYGTLGHIRIPEFKSPETFEVLLDDGTSYSVKKPFDINGFEYEIREVNQCIAQNKISSDIMTHEQSIAVMGIMDELREQWKIKFPFES